MKFVNERGDFFNKQDIDREKKSICTFHITTSSMQVNEQQPTLVRRMYHLVTPLVLWYARR